MKTVLHWDIVDTAIAAGLDRRRKARFLLKATCSFWWHSEEIGAMFGIGCTMNLSSEGIYVLAQPGPLPEQLLAVEIELPTGSHHWPDHKSVPNASPSSLSLRGEGRVVRVDALRGGFAAQICFGNLDAVNPNVHEILTRLPGDLPS
jgi:hypothetical protein